jgi:hypothetical protein
MSQIEVYSVTSRLTCSILLDYMKEVLSPRSISLYIWNHKEDWLGKSTYGILCKGLHGWEQGQLTFWFSGKSTNWFNMETIYGNGSGKTAPSFMICWERHGLLWTAVMKKGHYFLIKLQNNSWSWLQQPWRWRSSHAHRLATNDGTHHDLANLSRFIIYSG